MLTKILPFCAFLILACHDTGPEVLMPMPPDPPDPPEPTIAINKWIGGIYKGTYISQKTIIESSNSARIEIDTVILELTPNVMPSPDTCYYIQFGPLTLFSPGFVSCFHPNELLRDSVVRHTHYASFQDDVIWDIKGGTISYFYSEVHPFASHINDVYFEKYTGDFRR